MTRLTTIELQKENMKFSIGHFTLFSATEREPLHGHNYFIHVALTTEIDERYGLSYDYRFYKKRCLELCKKLNQYTLIPQNSPWLSITDKDPYYHIAFADEVIIFLKRDVKLIPLTNITVEELAYWFIQEFTQNETQLAQHKISAITVKVFSAPGQSGSASWQAAG